MEKEALEAIRNISMIVGNSRNIKLIPHNLIIVASKGFRNEKGPATQQLKIVKELVDNIKVHKDLQSEVLFNIVNIASYFQLLGKDELLTMCDESIKSFQTDDQDESVQFERVVQCMNVKHVVYRVNGQIDASLKILREEIIPFQERILAKIDDPNRKYPIDDLRLLTSLLQCRVNLMDLYQLQKNFEEGEKVVRQIKAEMDSMKKH